MSATPVVFMYGLLIISGAMMVLYGLSQKPREECESSGAPFLDDPTDEALELDIKGSEAGIEGCEPMVAADPVEPAPMEYAPAAPKGAGGNFSNCIEKIRSQFRSRHRMDVSEGATPESEDGKVFDLEREALKPEGDAAPVPVPESASADAPAAEGNPLEVGGVEAGENQATTLQVSASEPRREIPAEDQPKKADARDMTALDLWIGDQLDGVKPEASAGDAAKEKGSKKG